MADRDFQIKEELLLHFCSLEIPPGAPINSQITSAEVKNPKKWLTFYVERSINRIKSFKILKNTLPVSLLRHIDNILWTCTAFCNLKPKLICLKEEKDKSNA